MTVRASTDRSFYKRLILIGAAAFGFALWCLYDGTVKYPAQNVLVIEYERLNDEGRGNEWREFAREKGWPIKHPGELKDDADIIVQYVMAGMAATIGLGFFVPVLISRGKWIEVSESQLTSSWGQSFELDRVVSIDKKQWKDKGIAKITYKDGDRNRRFVLDNFKFDRHPTTEILRQIEANVGPDKIVGGPPEPAAGQTDGDAAEPIPEASNDPE